MGDGPQKQAVLCRGVNWTNLVVGLILLLLAGVVVQLETIIKLLRKRP